MKGGVSNESVGGQGLYTDVEIIDHEQHRLARHAGNVVYQEPEVVAEVVQCVVWSAVFVFLFSPPNSFRQGSPPARATPPHCQGCHCGNGKARVEFVCQGSAKRGDCGHETRGQGGKYLSDARAD
jgi:hypothetical protein